MPRGRNKFKNTNEYKKILVKLQRDKRNYIKCNVTEDKVILAREIAYHHALLGFNREEWGFFEFENITIKRATRLNDGVCYERKHNWDS